MATQKKTNKLQSSAKRKGDSIPGLTPLEQIKQSIEQHRSSYIPPSKLVQKICMDLDIPALSVKQAPKEENIEKNILSQNVENTQFRSSFRDSSNSKPPDSTRRECR